MSTRTNDERPALDEGPAKRPKVAPFLRPSLLLMKVTDHNLKLASQIGVTDIVVSYSGSEIEDIMPNKLMIEKYGMSFTVIERLIPHDKIVHNKPGRDEQIENFKRLVRNASQCGIKTLCYNWMPADDWSRTSVDTLERGGALVTAFDASQDDATAMVGEKGRTVTDAAEKVTTAEELWENLEYFLRAVLPVAEECGVKLAMHPDDPPMPMLRGRPQIMFSVANMERACKLVPSPSNGVCFCQGTFASAGEDIVAGIRTLGPYIHYIHFRDVNGVVPHFTETWQDTGKTDMALAMRTYRDVGITDVPIRPDHVPTMDGEANGGQVRLG